MITVRQVQDAVCKYFDISRDQMLEQNRHQGASRPRQVAMYLSREMTGKSWCQLGRAFCRDHTTVLTGCRRVDRLQVKPHWRMAVAEIRADLLDPEGARRKEYEVMMGRMWKASVPHCFAPGAYADEAICHAFLKEAAE